MNHGPKATEAFLENLVILPKPEITPAKMRLYVPYLSLPKALEIVASKKLDLQIGAQNMHFETSGAFTGEISGPMLSEIGVNQVLIGHSERRQYYNETNESVLKKILSSLAQGFEVLVCIGETLAERNSKKTEAVLTDQLSPLLSPDLCKAAFGKTLHIAYEPVWAIGTGLVATPEQAQETHAFIRQMLSKSLKPEATDLTRILYGGSVSPSNFKELLLCPDIDGGLVGGASVKVDSFMALWNLI